MRRAAALVALAFVALAAFAGDAVGDADPPSDYLFLQDVYYPYNPKVSAGLQARLDELAARSRKAGFPIKVAIIGTPSDLGAVPKFWGRPQPYAKFLASEIRNGPNPQPLLTVMPTGYGTVDTGARGAAIAAAQPRPLVGSDGLASGAITAVQKLAAANGTSLDTSGLGTKPTHRQPGGSLWLFLAPIGLLAIAAGGLAIVSRRRRSRTPDAGA